ncbi:MAG: UDP-3-O-acyl-N-acetylglucosamine deacetylase [Desulfurivibrionaceae bacterium]|nr:UDP-3-O-acyl-N-acetylglucosamine deacetylase [Desulfurivibrionaceae bacterium]
MWQHTVKKEISFAGVGLHSGKPVKMRIKPAAAHTGIRFKRVDLGQDSIVRASMRRVSDTTLATTLSKDNVFVGTTEHLLAALCGLGIDNVMVELDSDELPIMDGSAGPFVQVLKKNRKEQKARRLMMKITKEMTYKAGATEIHVKPFAGFKITSKVQFDHPVIKSQSYTVEIDQDSFVKEIASARTFGFLEQVEYLRANGKALGGSLENAVVIDQDGVVNAEGLRFADEFARHKILDLVGDLALLGCPLLGHITACRGGHTQHVAFMRMLAANQDCWELVKHSEDGKESVMDKMRMASRAAGKIVLPFLLPPAPRPSLS